MAPTNPSPRSLSTGGANRPPRMLWLATVWGMTCASTLFGLAVVGTASLMIGNVDAIESALVLWAVGTALSIIGVHSALSRSTVALAVSSLAAPCALGLLIARFVLGVEI